MYLSIIRSVKKLMDENIVKITLAKIYFLQDKMLWLTVISTIRNIKRNLKTKFFEILHYVQFSKLK